MANVLLFIAKDRQADACLHANPFAGRKDMEREVRNVRMLNRAGISLSDLVSFQKQYSRAQLTFFLQAALRHI